MRNMNKNKEEWKTVELKKVVTILNSKRKPLNGQQRKMRQNNPQYPYYGANNMIALIDDYIFDQKILCVAEDGGSWGGNSKCSFIVNERCWVNNHAHVLGETKLSKLEYLSYFLNYTDLTKYVTGSTRGKLTKSSLQKIKIPLPPLPVQKQIADLLDTADALRQKTKDQLAALDELAQATFLDMFGDPVTNEKGWEVKKLNEVYVNGRDATKCGPFGSALKKNEYVSSGYSVWTMGNIQNMKFVGSECLYITENKFNDLKSYRTQPNDIIISRAGTVGKMCVLPNTVKEGIISTNLIRLRLDLEKISPIYFVLLMGYFGPKVGKLRTGQDGAFTHMNTGVLNKLKIPLPPIQLQNQFAYMIENIEAQKATLEASLKESEDLFNSLLQDIFS